MSNKYRAITVAFLLLIILFLLVGCRKFVKRDIVEIKEGKIIEAEIAEKEIIGEDFIDFTDATLCAKGTRCLLKKDAYALLLKASEIADNYKVALEVYSAYRSKQEQIDIWEGRTPERYAQRYPNENTRIIYVCYPYGDVEDCPHLTGKAIDVRFREKEGKMEARDWRLLHKIMSEAGWIRYANEAWHFECCWTKRYAKAKSQGVTEVV